MKLARLKSFKERRQYYRYETELNAGFRREGTSDFTPVKIVNISVVGAYLKSKKPLISGKEIEFSFILPGAYKRPINCWAKVVWTARFEGYHSGIEFTGIERIDKYRIAGFITNELRKKKLK